MNRNSLLQYDENCCLELVSPFNSIQNKRRLKRLKKKRKRIQAKRTMENVFRVVFLERGEPNVDQLQQVLAPINSEKNLSLFYQPLDDFIAESFQRLKDQLKDQIDQFDSSYDIHKVANILAIFAKYLKLMRQGQNVYHSMIQIIAKINKLNIKELYPEFPVLRFIQHIKLNTDICKMLNDILQNSGLVQDGDEDITLIKDELKHFNNSNQQNSQENDYFQEINMQTTQCSQQPAKEKPKSNKKKKGRVFFEECESEEEEITFLFEEDWLLELQQNLIQLTAKIRTFD